MFDIVKTYFKTIKEIKKVKKIADSDLFYKDLNEIPLFNWWQCKNGKYEYLWKKHDSYVPQFFKKVFDDMYFQLDYVDTEEIRKEVQKNIYYSKYLTTQDIKWKRKADTESAKVKLIKSVPTKELKLNDLIKSVQKALDINYYLDARIISAGYFWNLYSDAINQSSKHGYN